MLVPSFFLGVGLVTALVVIFLVDRNHRAHARALYEENYELRDVIAELSVRKYGRRG